MFASAAQPALGTLILETRRLLQPLRPRRRVLPAEFAVRVSGDRRFRLRSRAWTLHGQGTAECRTVAIAGRSTTIVNILIVPTDGWRVPVFVADYVATHGQLRVGFVDLQVPGLPPPTCQAVQVALLETPGKRSLSLDAPPWAAEFSSGQYWYVRPSSAEEGAAAQATLDRYLTTWMRIARTTTERDTVAMSASLDRFGATHIALSPAGTYLSRLFGTVWTNRYLREFLYA